MAKPALLPSGPGFDGPPLHLRARDPVLYDFLSMLYDAIYGSAESLQGRLNSENIDLSGVAFDHSRATHLDADDHPQYLNTTRHAQLGTNPHGTTAEDVGSDQAVWNARYLLGRILYAAVAPSDGDILVWDDANQRWAPETHAQISGTYVKTAVDTVSPPEGTAAYIASGVVPASSLILAVKARNINAIGGGVTSFLVGTSWTIDAWGVCGVTADAENSIGDFSINNPRYSGSSAEDVLLTPNGANWPAGVAVELTVHYWDGT